MSLRRRSLVAVLATLGLICVVTPPALGLATVRFKVELGSTCLAGYGPPGANGTASLLGASSELIDRESVTSDGTGYWYTSRCFSDPIVPGLKVRATFGSAGRTVTVPTLSMRIDRATDVFSGRAPATVGLELSLTYYTGYATWATASAEPMSDAAGAWSVDLTGTATVRGGDLAQIRYTNSSGDDFYRWEYAPQLRILLGSTRVYANLLTGSGTTATLRTTGGALRARAGLASSGFAYDVLGQWTTSTGLPVFAAAGNKIEWDGASDASMTLGSVTATVVTTTDVVSGSCLPSRPYGIHIVHPSPYVNKLVTGTCSAGGTYNRDVSGTINIVARDEVIVSSKTTTGDLVQRRLLAP